MKNINKIRKIILILIGILLVIIGIYVIFFILPNKKEEIKEEGKILNYVLYDRDGDLAQEIFNKLKEEIEGETNYENYASYIAELFIIDLYSLNNKKYETDITSIQYVYEGIRDNFKLKVSETLYKNILLSDELPTVTSVVVNNVEKSTYKIETNKYDSYIVNISWEYDKDYGYEKEKNITLVNIDNNMYVVDIGDIDE